MSASLADTDYIKTVHDKVVTERKKWNDILDQLHLKHTDSQANFVYFDINKPYDLVAGEFRKQGIIIARSFPPYSTWIRITIGLPEDNLKAQAIVRQLAR